MQKGFTLIELMIVIAILGIITAILSGAFINNQAQTEKRALKNVDKMIQQNHLQVQMRTCAGDSDRDGYGTCSIMLTNGKQLQMECPTNFFDVVIMGAEGCKQKSLVNMDYQNQGQ